MSRSVPLSVLTACLLSVVAEAWVNGAYVGARPWQPFVFDVTQPLRPGANHLRVRVANTEANARAVGAALGNLKNIELNGWLGPARPLPYFQREIRCREVQGTGDRVQGTDARAPRWNIENLSRRSRDRKSALSPVPCHLSRTPHGPANGWRPR